MKPIYMSRHWKYYNKNRFHIEGVSRKTKKHLQKAMREGYLPTASEERWVRLLDCKWCNGGGTYRDHPSDTGFGCPDCCGTGKSGWYKSIEGKMHCSDTGLEVKEY